MTNEIVKLENRIARIVQTGRVYRHFKGYHCLVLYIANHTETEENLVIYQCLNNGKIYARPYYMFLSEVDHAKYPNATQKYRFELIEGEKEHPHE